MKIRAVDLIRRASLVQGALLVLVLVLSGATVLAYRAAEDRARRTEDTLHELELLRSEVLSAETSLRGYLLVAQERFLEPYYDAAPRVRAALRALGRSSGAEDRASLDRIGHLHAEWRSRFAEVVLRRLAEGRRDEAFAMVEAGEGRIRTDAIRAEVERLAADARSELDDQRERASLVGLVGVVLSGVAVVVSVVTAVRSMRRLERSVASPLADLAATAERFGDGDLSARAVPNGVVEVQRLASAFNAMAASTEATVTDLRTLDRMKSEFVSVVSHELRTPLTSIRGSLGLLASGAMGEVPPEAVQMLGIAVTNTDRLVRLINDILDLERIESGEQALDLRPTEVSAVMTDAVANVAGMAEEAGVTVDVATVAATVHADADRLVQALTNLLGNAIKFSEPGANVRLDAEVGDAELTLRVVDQGRGIPADKLETIFGRFQQVDVSDARDKGGTGLGLAIVKSVAERHGGRVDVESQLGAGSCFSIVLPIGLTSRA